MTRGWTFQTVAINVLVSVSGARFSKWRKRSEQVQCSSPFGGEISCCWLNSRRRTKSGATVWGSCGNLVAADRKWQHEICYEGYNRMITYFLNTSRARFPDLRYVNVQTWMWKYQPESYFKRCSPKKTTKCERARLTQLTSYVSNLIEVFVQCHCASISNLLWKCPTTWLKTVLIKLGIPHVLWSGVQFVYDPFWFKQMVLTKLLTCMPGELFLLGWCAQLTYSCVTCYLSLCAKMYIRPLTR